MIAFAGLPHRRHTYELLKEQQRGGQRTLLPSWKQVTTTAEMTESLWWKYWESTWWTTVMC